MCKYIFITGGVVSGIGKGITAASLGRLLKQRGLRVINQKFDPYINVDPGTMNPYQHGEVFVTEDGAETDLDLGHYERFVDEPLDEDSNTTTGKIYLNVIKKERNGEFLGQTVQVIPHITNEIKEKIYVMEAKKDINKIDVVITEIGGTVGDIESTPFLEAIRQVPLDVGAENVLYIHVTLLPYLATTGEIKTKPTQHSVKELLNMGIQPNILVCRSEHALSEENKRKIALFCNVKPEEVIVNKNVNTLYEVPLMLEKEGLAKVVCKKLNLKTEQPNLLDWTSMVENIYKLEKSEQSVKIAIVGKYVELHDAYLSVMESLKHGGFANEVRVEIDWVSAEELTQENIASHLSEANGILVPGGFGDRGIEGKILAANYARKNDIPYFGICLGMQVATIEFARNVLGFTDAHSTEFDPQTTHPLIYIIPDKKNLAIGGTLRLGSYPCMLLENTLAREIYKEEMISERHRHRFEFNKKYKEKMEAHGFKISGTSPNGELTEIIEIPSNRWFLGVQFHPEFKSRPNNPHPLFKSFIKAAIGKKSAKPINKNKFSTFNLKNVLN